MPTTTIVFFGSFQEYSVQVLKQLAKHFLVTAVVTTPPKPAGRGMLLLPTQVHDYALSLGLPVFPLETLATIPQELARPDFIVVAGYGKLIPPHWLDFPKLMPVNLHPSLLPHYRGAFPAEWAILRGETQTGVTLVAMSPEFDKGDILVQQTVRITPNDTRQTLYTKLYTLGARLLTANLPKIAKEKITPRPQPAGIYFYARKITREDGFIPWQEFAETVKNRSTELATKLRALSGWPGVWTMVKVKHEEKRLKLISLKPDVMVQLEGKNPVPFAQFTQAYLP